MQKKKKSVGFGTYQFRPMQLWKQSPENENKNK